MQPTSILSKSTWLTVVPLGLCLVACGSHGLKLGRPDGGIDGGDAKTAGPAGDATVAAPATDAAVGATEETGGWTLPPDGGPGWRNSSRALCLPSSTSYLDLWSSARGVYALASGDARLYFNSGQGWALTPEQPAQDSWGLTGVAQNDSLLFEGSVGCAISLFDGKSETCVCALAASAAVFAVDSQHIYAVNFGSAARRVLSYNGSYFTQFGNPLPPESSPLPPQLWASAEVIVVPADAGKVYVYDLPSTEPRTLQIPGGGDATSVWGFGRDDLWVGSRDGRLAHYDGVGWTVSTLAQGECAAVTRLWGAEQTLFFATGTTVGRMRGGQSDVIFTGPCSQRTGFDPPGIYEEVSIKNLWGNSPTEVFIALEDQKIQVIDVDGVPVSLPVSNDGCGPFRIYWFDGERLGRL